MGINVLSLFDGLSGGQIALNRCGIEYDNYYASEIDKYCIQITQKNYPDTIQLGDVNNWQEWDLPEIDLLIGGFPCQSFSMAGKQLNFKDERGKLFFRLVEVLKHYKPKYFLFENVKMKKEFSNAISDILKTKPILINSNLVSAQNRQRYYWTNIPCIKQPEDKKIFLKDVVMKNAAETLIHSNKAIDYMNKKTKDGRTHWDFAHYSDVRNDKSATIVANFFKGIPYNVFKDWDCIRKLHPVECERLQTIPDNYTDGVSNTQRYKMIGNAFTVDVIGHILVAMKVAMEQEYNESIA